MPNDTIGRLGAWDRPTPPRQVAGTPLNTIERRLQRSAVRHDRSRRALCLPAFVGVVEMALPHESLRLYCLNRGNSPRARARPGAACADCNPAGRFVSVAADDLKSRATWMKASPGQATLVNQLASAQLAGQLL
jgi:hypothetical protein